MTPLLPTSLSDSALLAETVRAAGVERHATAELLALLAEVDRRRLYLGLGYSSLFVYCMQTLRLSEPAAYSRITAARAAARWPAILTRLAAGDVTLTTVTLLSAHLTDENHEMLLDAVRHQSKREVERLIARLDPQPDVPSTLRRFPAAMAAVTTNLPMPEPEPPAPAPKPSLSGSAVRPSGPAKPAPSRPVVAPLSADRYLLKVTLSEAAHEDFARVRDLLRHTIPTGDPAAIVARALSVLRDRLERTRHGAARRHKAAQCTASRSSRHVPAAIRRVVWRRDGGRCAFVGTEGRCAATGFLEFHHVVPFSRGGATTAENLELRCRAHNMHEAVRVFGARVTEHRREPEVRKYELCPDRAGE